MGKKCPFKPIVVVEAYKWSGGRDMNQGSVQHTNSFAECDEDECMAWNSSNSTCKRLDQVVIIETIEKSITENEQIKDATSIKSPCGAKTCSGCPDYGYANEYPCPDWCEEEIQSRKNQKFPNK